MIPENGQENEHGRLAGGLGPLFSGLIAATLIALTLLAAVAMGMGEQQMLAQVEPSLTATATPLRATPVPSATAPATFTAAPSSTFTPTASPTLSDTVTLVPEVTTAPTYTRRPIATPTRCNAYPVWGPENVWVVQRGDTLYSISIATDTSVAEIKWANCLTSNDIVAGQELYVRRLPPTPRPTIPPPSIKTFTLDPADQVIVGECVKIEWVVQGVVEKITLFGDGVVLVPDAPTVGSYSDCPTEAGTRRYTLRAWGPDVGTYRLKSIKVVDDSITPTPTSGTPTLTPTAGSPAPATDTPTPTPTDTPVPPTNTPTNTPVPPTNTPTHTPVPPTSTNTPEPEAARPREMAFMFEPFRSWAAVSLPQAHLPAL